MQIITSFIVEEPDSFILDQALFRKVKIIFDNIIQ